MNFKIQSPITIVVLLYTFGMFFQRVGSYFTAQFTDNSIYQNLGENSFGVIFVIVATSKLKMWSKIHWLSRDGLNRAYLFILPAAYIFLNLGEWYPYSLEILTAGVLSTIFTGVLEELLCRGLVIALLINFYQSANKNNVELKAVIVSSLIFGVVHLLNIFEKPDEIGAIMGQVIYATFIGIGFAACYIKTKSLIPLIFIHIGINLMSFLTSAPHSSSAQSFTDTIGVIIICSPLAFYGVLLLTINRKKSDAFLVR